MSLERVAGEEAFRVVISTIPSLQILLKASLMLHLLSKMTSC